MSARAAFLSLATGTLAGWLGCLALAGCTSGPTQPAESAPKAVSRGGEEGSAVQPPLLEACTATGPERCFNAVDDNCNGLLEEGCPVRSGIVQFAAAWQQADADVDLNVVDPNGELAEEGRVTEAKLTKERDCPSKDDGCQGHNMENVYLEGDEPARGLYRVSVRLERLGASPAPVTVILGVRLGSRSFAAELALDEEADERRFSLRL